MDRSDLQQRSLKQSQADWSVEMYELIQKLYPICRSLTGNGVRDTLKILQKHIPLTIHEVPTNTPVFDWTVPKEWNIRDAYIKSSNGEKIVDFNKCNLHVLNYSLSIHKKVSLEELKKHIFTLPEYPDWVPYRTSYYTENWGFCLSHNQLSALADGEYEVCIDASLQNGHLTYGEYFLKGGADDEVLISTHICHPSLANDNLSGIALAAFLSKHLSTLAMKYSYRFLFVPGTIGSITWLCQNESNVGKIKHGLVLACLGDPGKVTYKRSRRGDAEIDRAVIQVLRQSGDPYEILEFSPYGYDERQFCSPGFNLPMGCLMRTPHGCFPEYHTSADNLEFISPQSLADSFSKCLSIFNLIETNAAYVNLNPKCEPQLGKRGLYRAIGGQTDAKAGELAILWVLNFSDGNFSLLDIAERSDVGYDKLKNAADLLTEHGLLRPHRPVIAK
jgi:aminopeptidase-like protein